MLSFSGIYRIVSETPACVRHGYSMDDDILMSHVPYVLGVSRSGRYIMLFLHKKRDIRFALDILVHRSLFSHVPINESIRDRVVPYRLVMSKTQKLSTRVLADIMPPLVAHVVDGTLFVDEISTGGRCLTPVSSIRLHSGDMLFALAPHSYKPVESEVVLLDTGSHVGMSGTFNIMGRIIDADSFNRKCYIMRLIGISSCGRYIDIYADNTMYAADAIGLAMWAIGIKGHNASRRNVYKQLMYDKKFSIEHGALLASGSGTDIHVESVDLVSVNPVRDYRDKRVFMRCNDIFDRITAGSRFMVDTFYDEQ